MSATSSTEAEGPKTSRVCSRVGGVPISIASPVEVLTAAVKAVSYALNVSGFDGSKGWMRKDLIAVCSDAAGAYMSRDSSPDAAAIMTPARVAAERGRPCEPVP